MKYLTNIEAAEFLTENGFPTTHNTLTKLRCIGGGAAFYKFGRRVLYTEADLLTWAQSKMSPPCTSSSEHGLQWGAYK